MPGFTIPWTAQSRSGLRSVILRPFALMALSLIRARSIWPNGDMSVVVSKQYTKLSTYKAGRGCPRSLEQGLKCEYYAGHWTKLPEFDQLKPVRASIAPKMNLGWVADMSNRTLACASLVIFGRRTRMCTASLPIPMTVPDSPLPAKSVVNNDGVHGMAEQDGEIALGAGVASD